MTPRERKVFVVFVLLVLIIAFAVIGQMVRINAASDKYLGLVQNQRIEEPEPAVRGNIFSCDGRLLSSTLPKYELRLDTRANDTVKKYFKASVDTLARVISQYSRIDYNSCRKGLLIAYEKGSRYYKAAGDVTYVNKQKMEARLKHCKGCYRARVWDDVEKKKRSHPFGRMAMLGNVGENNRGNRGIELKYDSILQGEEGRRVIRKLAGKRSKYITVEPVDGCDIVTTIDVDIQDVADKVLRTKVSEIQAEQACLVLMEVATGEIRACVNLDRDATSGTYYEGQNHFVMRAEPGSTFKVASLMVALEEGKVRLSDSIDTYDGVYKFYDRSMRDANYQRGGYGRLSVKDVLAYSSNVGTSRIIWNSYKENPKHFVERIYDLGIAQDLDLEIKGYTTPLIRHPSERGWTGTTLPWMSIGYELEISPIYTLAFYNAIANGGNMVRPYFVKQVVREDGVEVKQPKVVKSNICSQRVLGDICEALKAVVEYGTGRAARSPYVTIAGKTGTAQIGYGKGGPVTHQVSFCGFFPADEPLYSGIVVIRNPRVGVASGGAMSGAVFKQVAERVYAMKVQQRSKDMTAAALPCVKQGMAEGLDGVFDDLSLSRNAKAWSEQVMQGMSGGNVQNLLVPDVRGMGARDAVYMIEKAGIRACIASGQGAVVEQSLAPGTRCTQGSVVYIRLK